ncbi:SDR family oxidoreductase [Halomonas sp. G15]|uniref:SDR family NAD(P)-dependent oxidoreductase n=1 Tax=Halomonas sp. G15 TaxID=2903521 RepID=UPI001E55432B|nr:SDR family NAD(P)-dependent oxidoreductase [Halomonas sp. G15]MCE0732434.1 SDR family oxidoreductase [Halomonas sp. G15]
MLKRALITAGAGGIGAAIALKAKADGYDVTISDIDIETGEKLAAENGLTFIACDLGDEAQVVEMIEKVGRVDLLVNNAGISGPTTPIAELATSDWNKVFAINVTATFIVCREMVRLMKSTGGSIVNISSVAAKIGYPNRAAYAASKRAVLGLTASLAREVGHDGIRVNAVLPGTVRGARIDDVIAKFAEANDMSIEDAQATYLKRHADGRFVEPEEIASLVVYLGSDAARSITSEFISIDGGFE